MAANDKYFQFPICALRLSPFPECLNDIIFFCCVERGKSIWRELPEAERNLYLSGLKSPFKSEVGVVFGNKAHIQAALGARFLEVTGGNVAGTCRRHEFLSRFVCDFEGKHGRDARVRIISTWVFDARDRHGLSFLELAVLVAIYSKIGRKRSAVLITRDEIWRRAHGCKSKAVFAALTDALPFHWTKGRVRATIHRLFARNCFSRVTYGRRHTYYSNRLSQAELEESVVRKKTLAYVGSRRQQDASERVNARVFQERLRILTRPPL
jgi:predicted transcriptional regulator